MKQLLLDIASSIPPSLGNFVFGENLELRQVLGGIFEAKEKMIYLWGEEGSGKSHLLQACVSLARNSGKSAILTSRPDESVRDIDLVAIDDVEKLDESGQIELFHLYNHIREKNAVLIASGNTAAHYLPLRPDVVTRLGWGLVYHIRPLTDAEKEEALLSHAGERAMKIPLDVIRYLMHHGNRDLRSLLSVLDALDSYSLEKKRHITVPLLKEVLNLFSASARNHERTTCA